jgi:hypothetical protein
MPFISNYRHSSVSKVHEDVGETYVEAIEFRDTVVGNKLRDCRISLGQPPEELWDTLFKKESTNCIQGIVRIGNYHFCC